MKAGKNVSEMVEVELPTVERYFNDASGVSFEDILRSVVKEEVECFVRPSYHDQQVNVATSIEGVA